MNITAWVCAPFAHVLTLLQMLVGRGIFFVFFNSCKYNFLFFWELCLVGASTYIFFIEIYTRSLHMKWEFNVFLYSGFTPPGVFLVIHVYRWRFTDLIRPMWNQCVSPLEAEVVFDLGFVGVSVGVGCIEKAGCVWWEMFVRFFSFSQWLCLNLIIMWRDHKWWLQRLISYKLCIISSRCHPYITLSYYFVF